MAGPLYPAKTIANLFNLTDRRIRQLAAEGVIPPPENGKYELIGSVQGYIRYLQERAFSKDLRDTDTHAQAVRVKKLTGDKLELELAALRNEVLDTQWVIALCSQLVVAARAKFLALPGKVKSRAPSLTEHAFSEMEYQVREALTELGDDGMPESLRVRLARDHALLEASAETDVESVGG